MFKWKRFWCSPDSTYSLGDGGYLSDPESEYGKIYQPNAVPFDKISDRHCLALLGEPGIGKSTTLMECIALAKSNAAAKGERLLHLDLKEFSSDDRLERHLVDASEFKEWIAQDFVLHVFLDSLDECRVRIPAVAAMLLSVFRKQRSRLEKLRLRIACRTADWPLELEEGFADLWGEEAYRAFELLPLRRVDVREAANASGISDPEAFLTAVEAVDAQPLAIKPITLKLLLSIYRDKQTLPSTQVELYRQGCTLLASETSVSRRASGAVGKLDPGQRLAVAKRVAAIMVLCRKTAIGMEPTLTPLPPDVIGIGGAAGGYELSKSTKFDISEEMVREVLGTGLFSSRGVGMMGFAHQTYAEFLAADYLAEHKLDATQIMSLICHQNDPSRRVVPQLAEMAAWLASMRPDVFKLVLATDPQVLLRSDAATADNEARAAMIGGLLEKADKSGLADDSLIRRRYGRFSHPGLDKQLRPYIVDKSKHVVVRRMAIDIAEAAAVLELQPPLLSVALDASDAYHIRDQATHAIAQIGDDEHRRGLIPLLKLTAEKDPDDQLRGCAMRALWPRRLISIDELLSAMTDPRRGNFLGAYAMFLMHEFAEYLEDSEIQKALDWARNLHESVNEDSAALLKVDDAVLLRAIERMDDAATLSSVADYAINRLADYKGLFSDFCKDDSAGVLYNNEHRRRQLIEVVIARWTSPGVDVLRLVGGPGRLVMARDFGWLVLQASRAQEARQRSAYAQLAFGTIDGSDWRQIDEIVVRAETVPELREAFASWLTPVEIDSDAAKKARLSYERYREMSKSDAPPPAVDPPMKERILDALGRFEAGEVDAWWQLNRLMLFDHAGRARDHDELDDDLRELPGWKDADEGTRARLVSAAWKYIEQGDPGNDKWLGTNIIHRPALAGYRAFVLLAHCDSRRLSEVAPANWGKWAASVIGFPISVSIVGNEQPALDLVRLAYHNAPNEAIAALSKIIDKEDAEFQSGDIFIHRKMANCWDDRLSAALLEKAKEPALKPRAVGHLLEELVSRGYEPAVNFAGSLLSIPLQSAGRPRDLAFEAAVVLMEQASGSGWDTAWLAVKSDNVFGKSVLEAVAVHDRRSSDIGIRVSEGSVGDLYVWLARQYPHADDPKHDTVHSVGAREAVAFYRDNLLRALENRGTMAAVAAIQRIGAELPHLDWLRYVLLSAREKMLRRTWVPPAPTEVLALCGNGDSRLVRSAAELQDVLMETLADIGHELQGETPTAPELWNLPTGPSDRTEYRPKDENRLSDWLKSKLELRLANRGIITLREVEIRRGEGIGSSKGKGERTDLLITGTVAGPSEGLFDKVRVIIEVKGCWHVELQTAMQTQLVDRYLKDNSCQHGIYLVGWFTCPQWNENDHRKKATPDWPVENARHFFDKQAVSLSIMPPVIKALVLNAGLR